MNREGYEDDEDGGSSAQEMIGYDEDEIGAVRMIP